MVTPQLTSALGVVSEGFLARQCWHPPFPADGAVHRLQSANAGFTTLNLLALSSQLSPLRDALQLSPQSLSNQ